MEDFFEDSLVLLFGTVQGMKGEKGGSYSYDLPAGACAPGLRNTQIQLQLTGNDSADLFAHFVWNSGIELANQILSRELQFPPHSAVIELGAGAGLPSVATAALPFETFNGHVVVTDYPDSDIIRTLEENIKANLRPEFLARCQAVGYNWGGTIEPLLALLPSEKRFFDIVIMADTVWNVRQKG